jgi:hypothetical protein
VKLMTRICRRLAAPAVAFLALLILATPTVAASWRPAVELAPSGRVARSTSLAASGNTVHALYTRAGVVTYRRSVDGGRTFAAPMALVRSSATNTFTAVAIASYGERVAALYSMVQAGHPPTSLRVRISEDGGRTWTKSFYVGGTATPTSGAVAVSANGYWVAMSAGGSVGMSHATSAKFTSCGVGCLEEPKWTFQYVGTTTNRAVQNDPNSLDGRVALAAWGNRVNVFWASDGIAEGIVGHISERRSLDGGTTWLPEQTIASDAAVVVGSRPASVSAFSTTILVAYERIDGRGVVLRSTNAGATFSARAVTPAPSTGGNPDIQDVFIGYGGIARVVYASYASDASTDKLWIRTSTNGGATWGAAVAAVGASPTKKNFANVVSTSAGFVLLFGRFATPTGAVWERAYA